MNITRVLLQHSPSPDERPLRLGGMSGGMLESEFMAPGDSVRAWCRYYAAEVCLALLRRCYGVPSMYQHYTLFNYLCGV